MEWKTHLACAMKSDNSSKHNTKNTQLYFACSIHSFDSFIFCLPEVVPCGYSFQLFSVFIHAEGGDHTCRVVGGSFDLLYKNFFFYEIHKFIVGDNL